MAPDLRQLLNWGGWVLSLPVLLFAAGPFFGGAWHALRRRRIGMDVPVALGLTVAFVASTGATFAPGGWFGHEVYFDSLTMFVSFLLGARYLEMRTRHRAALQLEGTMSLMPPSAWREGEAGRVEQISVQRLQPGDVVRVPLGEAFPADGPLLAGRTQADEALLSGESTPVSKQAGDMLVAGSRNVGGPVRQRVERVGTDTRLERIVALMRQAATQRPEAVRLADRWAAPFLWAVLVLAAGTAAAWSLFDPARALPAAVAVLIVTCPCALSLAVPSTLVAAAGGLARRGVLLQRLEALDALARFDHLLIDKTGTLTIDQLQLRSVRVAPHAVLAEPALRAVAAALARWSSHPVAVALQSAAEAGGDLSEVQEQPGVGLVGRDDAGRRWTLAQVPADAPGWVGTARSLLCVDGVPQAAFDLDEVLRPGVSEALARLRSEGVKLTLLSGDARDRVRAVAQRLGLDEWQAGATPDDKLAAAASAQRGGHCVGMVGDGVNDGPVLARADLSLAMGQGALVARAQADAVVMSGDWADLLRARATARRSLRIVKQNLVWAAAYNAVGIPLAVLGWLPPWAAGLGMALSSLAVVANSGRAARLPH
jgi:Cu2+-exporting ATPase